MKKSFVKQEVAVMAKEKGFNEPCIAIYGGITLSILSFPIGELENLNNHSYIKAPIHQQLVDWLDKNHNIHVSRIWYNDEVTTPRWVYHIDGVYVGSDFDEALIQALNKIK